MPARRLHLTALVAASLLVPLLAAGAQAAPAPSPDPSATAGRVVVQAQESEDRGISVAVRVAAMSVRERAAAVVMGHIPTADPAALAAYMSGGYGGFLLMGANVPATEAELRAVTAALTVDPSSPPLIAVDEEGGDVARLPWDDLPSALTLKQQPSTDAERAFAARSALLSRAGVGVNFGIVADVTADPGMFIYRRALGTSPAVAAERVAAAVEGESPLVMSTLKHFPGHGAAAGDSHRGIPSTAMTLDEWRASAAVPFAAGIEAGAPLLMFGHLAYTSVDPAPASLSAAWHAIARDELGFDGVAITDDLGMLQASGRAEYADPVANAVAALAAGNDMVLVVLYSDAGTAARIVDGIVAAVSEGRLSEDRLTEAATRVMSLRQEVAAPGQGLLPCGDCAAVG